MGRLFLAEKYFRYAERAYLSKTDYVKEAALLVASFYQLISFDRSYIANKLPTGKNSSSLSFTIRNNATFSFYIHPQFIFANQIYLYKMLRYYQVSNRYTDRFLY